MSGFGGPAKFRAPRAIANTKMAHKGVIIEKTGEDNNNSKKQRVMYLYSKTVSRGDGYIVCSRDWKLFELGHWIEFKVDEDENYFATTAENAFKPLDKPPFETRVSATLNAVQVYVSFFVMPEFIIRTEDNARVKMYSPELGLVYIHKRNLRKFNISRDTFYLGWVQWATTAVNFDATDTTGDGWPYEPNVYWEVLTEQDPLHVIPLEKNEYGMTLYDRWREDLREQAEIATKQEEEKKKLFRDASTIIETQTGRVDLKPTKMMNTPLPPLPPYKPLPEERNIEIVVENDDRQPIKSCLYKRGVSAVREPMTAAAAHTTYANHNGRGMYEEKEDFDEPRRRTRYGTESGDEEDWCTPNGYRSLHTSESQESRGRTMTRMASMTKPTATTYDEEPTPTHRINVPAFGSRAVTPGPMRAAQPTPSEASTAPTTNTAATGITGIRPFGVCRGSGSARTTPEPKLSDSMQGWKQQCAPKEKEEKLHANEPVQVSGFRSSSYVEPFGGGVLERVVSPQQQPFGGGQAYQQNFAHGDGHHSHPDAHLSGSGYHLADFVPNPNAPPFEPKTHGGFGKANVEVFGGRARSQPNYDNQNAVGYSNATPFTFEAEQKKLEPTYSPAFTESRPCGDTAVAPPLPRARSCTRAMIEKFAVPKKPAQKEAPKPDDSDQMKLLSDLLEAKARIDASKIAAAKVEQQKHLAMTAKEAMRRMLDNKEISFAILEHLGPKTLNKMAKLTGYMDKPE